MVRSPTLPATKRSVRHDWQRHAQRQTQSAQRSAPCDTQCATPRAPQRARRCGRNARRRGRQNALGPWRGRSAVSVASSSPSPAPCRGALGAGLGSGAPRASFWSSPPRAALCLVGPPVFAGRSSVCFFLRLFLRRGRLGFFAVGCLVPWFGGCLLRRRGRLSGCSRFCRVRVWPSPPRAVRAGRGRRFCSGGQLQPGLLYGRRVHALAARRDGPVRADMAA